MIVAVFICLCALLLTTCIARFAVLAGRYDDRRAAILARQPACSHNSAVPVDTLDGERVAWLCPDCDRQLPADRAGWLREVAR